jgi:hypothetical protein
MRSIDHSPQAMSTLANPDFVGIELTEADDEDTKEDTEAVSEDKQWVGVSDLAIGGRCKCNGHASECLLDKTTGFYFLTISCLL